MSVLQDNIQSVNGLIDSCTQAIDAASNQIKKWKNDQKTFDKINAILEENPTVAQYIIIDEAKKDLLNEGIEQMELTITTNKAQMKKLQKALATLQEIEAQ